MRVTVTALAVIIMSVTTGAGAAAVAGSIAGSGAVTSVATYQSTQGGNQSF
jgi:hypothetical protein